MSQVHSLQIGSNKYLIEPFLYTTTSGTGSAYTATIENYTIMPNTILFITVQANSSASPTLSINTDTPIPIYYQGAAVTANLLQAGQTYALTYSSDNDGCWNILNNLSENGTTAINIDSNGGLELGNNGLKIKASGIVNNMILDGTIDNNKLTYSSITIAGQPVSLGGTLTLADLGLTTVLHFKGIARNNTLAENSLLDPFSTDASPAAYNGEAGDVVIDNTTGYEYVWVNNIDGWEQLGSNETYKVVQSIINDPSANGATNAFIDSISQDRNGVITATKKYVEGWQYSRKVYTNLSNPSTTVEINGGASNATAIGIGIDGILPVAHGGTNNNTIAQGGVVFGAVTNTSPSQLYYDSVVGTQYSILTSMGSNAPHWTVDAFLAENPQDQPRKVYLELGNSIINDAGNVNTSAREGTISLFSAGSGAHWIEGAATNTHYVHVLPNADGVLVQIASASAVGSPTQPIYIAANGLATPLTYTVNRLYYSASTTSFVATGHYATDTQLGINITSWPIINGVASSDVLYVNGSSTITGIVHITDITDITNNTDGALVVNGGATIYKKLYVVDAVTFEDALNVGGDLVITGTSTLTDSVGIGTAPDTSSGDPHILHINGSTLISGTTNNLAHIDIINDNNNEVVAFIPETTGMGFIGIDSAQWQSASFSELLNIGSATAGIVLDATGFTEITNTNSSILLTTIDDNEDEIGLLNIITEIPTIMLTPNVSSTSYKTWVITNNQSVLTITNEDDTSLIGTNNGWEILTRLGIGTAPDTSLTDNHILAINGSTVIVNNTTLVAHLDVDTTESSLSFYPHTDKYGFIGYDAGGQNGLKRWNSVYVSNLIKIEDVSSFITLEVDDSTNNALIATLTMASTIPTICLNAGQNATWTITANTSGVFTLTNDANTELIGNALGLRLNSRLYINKTSALTAIDDLDLYVDGTTELLGHVGIGALPMGNTSDYLLYVNGQAKFTGDIHPSTDNTYSLGISSFRWKELYLSDSLTINDTTSGSSINLSKTGVLTITAAAPSIELDTTATGPNTSTWTFTNTAGVFTLVDDTSVILRGNTLGFSLNPRIYINSTIPASPAYNLYVNGDTYYNGDTTHNGVAYFANGTTYYIDNNGDARLEYLGIGTSAVDTNYALKIGGNAFITGIHYFGNDTTYYINANASGYLASLALAGDLTFDALSTTGISSKISWSGSGDGADIYYSVPTENQGNLVFNTHNDNNCLIALAYNNVFKAYFNNSIPSFYPATTNTGTLGTTTNHWSALYLGTENSYGDAYAPIYWNNGVPDVTYPVQYFTWTINSGRIGVQLTGINIFTTDTYDVSIVITSGAANLNGPITWTSNTNTFTIESSEPTSGAVSGYAIVARGRDITTSLSASQLTQNNS